MKGGVGWGGHGLVLLEERRFKTREAWYKDARAFREGEWSHGRRLGPGGVAGVEMNFTSLFSSFTFLLQLILDSLSIRYPSGLGIICH